nr:hypothetical protein CFP56_16619 [Quercus suber]
MPAGRRRNGKIMKQAGRIRNKLCSMMRVQACYSSLHVLPPRNVPPFEARSTGEPLPAQAGFWTGELSAMHDDISDIRPRRMGRTM